MPSTYSPRWLVYAFGYPLVVSEVEGKDVGRGRGAGMRMMVLIRIWVTAHGIGRPFFTRGGVTASDTLSADSGWIFKNRM